MTERPILFTPDNVRAILDGRKTQTRRVVKPQPEHEITLCGWSGGSGWSQTNANGQCLCQPIRAPYGHTGDALWVREAWALVPVTAYRASEVPQTPNPHDPHDAAIYKAGWPLSPPSRWRPSIHMPRWAARLTLRITEVRVERVQDISEADAIAEGAQAPGVPAAMTNRSAYAGLWDSINGKRGYPWESNPWVWVITFEVLK